MSNSAFSSETRSRRHAEYSSAESLRAHSFRPQSYDTQANAFLKKELSAFAELKAAGNLSLSKIVEHVLQLAKANPDIAFSTLFDHEKMELTIVYFSFEDERLYGESEWRCALSFFFDKTSHIQMPEIESLLKKITLAPSDPNSLR